MKQMTVIKLGGSLLDDTAARRSALETIAARWNAGESVVLVHGGGKHIDAAMSVAGIAKKTHAGLRITDSATLAIVVSVLAGTVNKMLVSELTKLGVKAAGLAGCDAGTLVAEKHPPIDGIELGSVGRVIESDCALIGSLLTGGILPVVSSIAAGLDGTLYNVNADSAAAAIAIAHEATSLQFLTDVPGLLDEHGIVVPALTGHGLMAMLASPVVSGGMRPKLEAALSALHAGVTRVTIAPPSGSFCETTKGGTTLVAA
jgi:acetylglutamate kinase